ncbi:MAG: hypothetical protein U0441_23720 [Polyangiaceae bacterium]
MSDKEKDKAEDEDRDDAPEGEADDASVKAKSKAKSAEDDDADEGDAKDEDGSEEGDEGAADRVAAALGLEDGEAAPEEGAAEAKEEEEAAAPQNRAARRREEALERRRKRKGLPAKKEGEAELPKDKNKRAKELLARRRESAVEAKQEPATLEAGEMVDDALSRMWAGTTKWLRKNLTAVQWVIAAGLVAGAGYVGYTYYTQKTLGAASDALAAGALAEDGHILAEDKRAEEDKELDPSPVYKTADERAEAALASYRDVQAKHPGSGAAILAKLGEAGVLLDKRDFDKAIEAFEAVQKTPLAAADVDVRARCIEGVGLAKEGKGDADGAMASFKTLEAIDARGFKELAQYHQARLLLAKNTDDDRAKAKDLLKTVYDKLKAPSVDAKPTVYLEHAVESQLKVLDPSAVPDRDSLQGIRGGGKSKEEIEAQIRKIQEQLGKKQGDGDGH